MNLYVKRALAIVPVIAIIAVGILMMAEPADASTYYYFKDPKNGASCKVGDSVSVSFWAGVEFKTTHYDDWGNPSTVTYEKMPVTLKVFKGSKQLDSREFTYEQATTIKTTYKPSTTGTLQLKIYGRPIGKYTQELQDTISIKVTAKKPSAVKKIKPKLSVARTGKKSAKITCSNYGGFKMKVYRSEKKSGKYKLVKTVKNGTFTDKKLKAKKQYYYKVRLFAKKGKKTYQSKWSSAKKAGKYVEQKDITLSYKAGSGVTVKWKAVSGVGYYLVSRNTVGTKGEYDVIACEGDNTTSYTDKDVVKGKTYYYAIVACKDNDDVIKKYMSDSYKIKVS